jgi:DNA-binding response OmpR family regulator
MNAMERTTTHKILLVDDDEAMLDMMNETRKGKGFDVVPVASVTEALKLITTESFDVLITDLHMPNPGDGFTLVTAMRHSQPKALTLLVSGYPDVQSAMAAILLEADEIIVKPFETGKLAELVREKVASRRPAAPTKKERVSAILQRCTGLVVADWLARVQKAPELNHLSLSDRERTGHLHKLVGDLIVRLGKPTLTPSTLTSEASDSESQAARAGDALPSAAAAAHGELRYKQGYTPAMLVHESRILQVTLFGILQENFSVLDFSLLLPDVMTIADEVDAQLTQSMESYMNAVHKAASEAAAVVAAA